MKGIKVIFDPQQFANLGITTITRYIRENRDTAVVGERCGVDRHIVWFNDWNTLMEYQERNPYKPAKPFYD